MALGGGGGVIGGHSRDTWGAHGGLLVGALGMHFGGTWGAKGGAL